MEFRKQTFEKYLASNDTTIWVTGSVSPISEKSGVFTSSALNDAPPEAVPLCADALSKAPRLESRLHPVPENDVPNFAAVVAMSTLPVSGGQCHGIDSDRTDSFSDLALENCPHSESGSFQVIAG